MRSPTPSSLSVRDLETALLRGFALLLLAAPITACGHDAALAPCTEAGCANGGGGGSGGGAGDGGGGGGPCAGQSCGPNEYCADPDGGCGSGSHWVEGQGWVPGASCQARPSTCAAGPGPVCGCDGLVYENACIAAQQGLGVGYAGCTPPAGFVACGTTFCDASINYCNTSGPIQDTEDAVLTCEPFPPECAGLPAPDCACVLDSLTQCTSSEPTCQVDGPGLQVSCTK